MLKLFHKYGLSGLYIGIIIAALLIEIGKWPRVTTVQAQAATGEKVIDLMEAQTRGDPVEITKVTVGDTDVQCGLLVRPAEAQPVTPFLAGSGWLRETTIFIFNRTNKTIVAAHLTLTFPETGDGHVKSVAAFPLRLGRLPAADSINGRTGQLIVQDSNQKPLMWAGGETLVIHLGDFADDIQNQIESELPLETVTRLRIHIGPFFFADGMKWSAGIFATPDSEHPGRFTNMPEDYFPGSPLVNWPPRKR